MVISAERAFWLLEFYRRRETRLIFGGRILGEEASCRAVVSHVWRENRKRPKFPSSWGPILRVSIAA
jgi:hypothetical protein